MEQHVPYNDNNANKADRDNKQSPDSSRSHDKDNRCGFKYHTLMQESTCDNVHVCWNNFVVDHHVN